MVALESSSLFSQLPADELKCLRHAVAERNFCTGHEIFKEGDTGDGVYVVKEGQVQISGVVGENARYVFSQAGPGEIFGEMAVLENKPRSASAVAATDTTVYFIPRAVMLEMVERSPRLALVLLQEISHRLREFNHHYVREVLQNERLALVGRFARSIVHDLKNPLNIISVTAELSGGENVTAPGRRAATDRIRRQVERISDMINDILDFTQGSPALLVPAPMDYATYVRQLIEEIQPEVQLKSVAIEFENQPPGVKLLLNPKRLRRVFHNLIHNAADAMPRGGKVILRFCLKEREVVTEIEDTGPGIAPEIADKLFEAFATYGKAHGTGLGLSICRKIVEDHHGRISARNEPERGAVFAFTLPLPTGG